MTAEPFSSVDPLFVAYVLAFGGAAVVCLAFLRSVHRIEDADTRRGLFFLLALSGGWAITYVAFLVAPSRDLKYLFYTVGLVIGLTTNLPWLYFCSAYTGRTLHRNGTYRRVLGAVFLFIILLKVTNPIHDAYFTGELVAAPFEHFAVEVGILHWLVLGFSYVLAAIGYFMLFELFDQVGHDTKPLAGLAGLAGVPVLLDIASLIVPALIEINYEPLGVAAFGVGVLFLYLDDFRTVQLAGEHEDPVIVLDEDDRMRDYNASAREIFPVLTGSIGSSIEDALPRIAERLDAEEAIVKVHHVGGLNYYGVTKSPFTTDRSHTGTLLSFTDITEREEYRRKLERQNDRLEQFASMVSHDLRNPLTVAKGNVELASEECDAEALDTTAAALDRMEALIDDVLVLARQGQPIDDTEPVELSATVTDCWGMVETGDAEIRVADDLTLHADPDRLRQLLENVFRNAVEHGPTSPPSGTSEDAMGDGDYDGTITAGALESGEGFYVADDGPGIPEECREQVFDSGFTTNPDGTGFGLAIVKEIVDAHGWEIRVTESAEGGARFEIMGVEIEA